MKTQIEFDSLIAAGAKIENEDFDTIAIANVLHSTTEMKNCTINRLIINSENEILLRNCKLNKIEIKNRSEDAELIAMHNCVGILSNGFELGLEGCSNAAFDNCKIAELILKNTTISAALFDGCRVEEVSITGPNNVVLDVLGFDKTTFGRVGHLGKAKIGNDTLFENCIFENMDTAFFRNMKKQYSDLGNDIQSDYFAAYELKSKYHHTKFKNDPINTVLGAIYLAINNFGLNPYRPISYLILVSILIPLFNQCSGLMLLPKDAFVFLIGPFKLLNEQLRFNKEVGTYTSFLLSLLSSIFWFFLIIGVRKRFKITHN